MIKTSRGRWFLFLMTAGVFMPAIITANSNIPPPPTTTGKPKTTTKIITTIRPKECPYFLASPHFVRCFYKGGGKCYCFVKANLDWAGAREFCRQGEMTLLRIEDYEEDYSIFVYGKYNPGLYYSDYWTSGKFSRKDRRWEWALFRPYKPMTYTNWKMGEPSNNEAASCVSLRFSYGDYYQWHWDNYRCSKTAGVICETNPKQ
ncbi:perlucin-like [Daphnia pulex]|uniref:perlucin-like n=1 Tax=Daphnia pulex TaxID=6669 RepID=UPI001EDCD58E|nr:perlucin-like [Daphnia pulex]